MIRPLIAIAAMVATVAASPGELDGKAIICEPRGSDIVPKGTVAPWGYEFREGLAVLHSIRRSGTNAQIKVHEGEPYSVYPTVVEWGEEGQITSLDRRTLRMRFIENGESPEWDIGNPCEISPSADAFAESMRAIRAARQNRIDNQMKDNKI